MKDVVPFRGFGQKRGTWSFGRGVRVGVPVETAIPVGVIVVVSV